MEPNKYDNDTFTKKQRDELNTRADERDWTRPRQSRFSEHEQDELDDTAKNLQFNDIQQSELTRRFRKRLLPFVAYIVMVAGIAVGGVVIENNTRDNHHAIIKLCQQSQSKQFCSTLYK
jgi:hypothetical protein